MRDEIDDRIWNDHHDQFSAFVGEAADMLAAGLRNAVGLAVRVPNQLLGIAAATAMTTLTFGSTIA